MCAALGWGDPHARHQAAQLSDLIVRAVGEGLVAVHLRDARHVAELHLVRTDLARQPLLCIRNLQRCAGVRGRAHSLLQLLRTGNTVVEEEALEHLVVDGHVVAAANEAGTTSPIDIHQIRDIQFGNPCAERQDIVRSDGKACVAERVPEVNEQRLDVVRRGHPERSLWCTPDRRDPSRPHRGCRGLPPR